MRRLLLLGIMAATGVVAGCASTTGPFQRTSGGERPDNPYFSISEQEKRGRAAWSLPDETFLGGPRSGAAHSIMGNGMTNGLNTGR